MKKLLSYIELIRDSAEVVIERMMVNYMKSIWKPFFWKAQNVYCTNYRIFSGDLGRNLSHIDAAIAFCYSQGESGLEQ